MSSEYDYNNDPTTGTENNAYTPVDQNTSGYYHSTGDPNNRPPENVRPESPNPGYTAPNAQQVPGQGQTYPSYDTGNGQSTNGYYAGGQNYGSGNVPPTGSMSGYNVSPAEPETPKKKKGIGGKAVVAVALVCALVGGLCGGGIAAAVKYSSSETETSEAVQETTAAEENEDAETENNTAISSKTIEVTTNSTSTTMTPQDVYENYVNAVVLIYNKGTTTTYFGTSSTTSSGSGMIITADGYVLTNNHVVEGAETLTVTTTSGEEYEATVVGADEVNDVALLKIESDTDFPTVSIGDSDSISVGQQVCAIGNPLGELTNTLTVGYVSALDREISESSTGTTINMFQTDCAINSGNSGGPIFDMNGNVVGITTAKYSSSGSSTSASVEGIGFCVPINDAMNVVNDLLEYGYVKGRVSMGVSVQTMDNSIVQYYNLPTGVYVAAVSSGSAAESAGIQQGDMICAIDGEETTTVAALRQKLKEYSPGDTATVSIYRSASTEKLEVEITFDEMQSTSTTEEEETTQNDTQSQGGTQMNPFGY